MPAAPSQNDREPRDPSVPPAERRSLRFPFWVAVLLSIPLLLLLRNTKPQSESNASSAAQIPNAKFTDITTQAGITFTHVNGAAGEKLLPETMGGGVAFLDFNNDNAPDLLFVNSSYWPWDASDVGKPRPTMALYRNDGKGRFTDVTSGSGLDVTFYGMGVAV